MNTLIEENKQLKDDNQHLRLDIDKIKDDMEWVESENDFNYCLFEKAEEVYGEEIYKQFLEECRSEKIYE